MGKAQSKRSVDITTEGKKGPEEEAVAGKVEKIEDTDDQKPQLNGDATPQEIDAKDKKLEETENEKDMATEKNSGGDGDAGGGGDQAQHNGEKTTGGDGSGAGGNDESVVSANADDTTVSKDGEGKDGGAATTPNAGGEEEISPLADESNKKTKKEKYKKKWSFRSISFGKKDKQKPAKTDAEAVSPTTNGETSDKTTDAAAADENKKVEENSGEADVKAVTANGEATEKELLNGAGDTTTTTTTPTDEKSGNNELTNDSATAATVAITNNTTASSTTSTSPTTATIDTNATTTASNQTESKIAADVNAAPMLSNGAVDAINDAIVTDKPQQNGTNGEGHADEEHNDVHAAIIDDAAAIKAASKSQIEFDIKTNEQDTVINNDKKIIDDLPTQPSLQQHQQIAEIAVVKEEPEPEAEIIQKEEILIEEQIVPPLPVCPPPSQVVAFAINSDIEEQQQQQQSQQAEEVQEGKFENETKIEEKVLEEKPEVKDIVVIEEEEVEDKNIAIAATASYLIDEITNKAASIVDNMQTTIEQQHPQLLTSPQRSDTTLTYETNVTLECEDVKQNVDDNLLDLADDDDDDDLPPPPPTPPFEESENEIEAKVDIDVEEENIKKEELDEEETSTVVPNAIEEVLNQFETKMQEIEEKVMNFEAISRQLEAEELLEEEHEKEKLLQKQAQQQEIVEEVDDKEENKVDEKPITTELISDNNENDIITTTTTIPTIIETTAATTTDIIDITQEIDKLKLNDDEDNNYEINGNNDNNKHNNYVEENADKVDSLQNLDMATLHITNAVKEIANPLELKENAAAADITTKDLAVSCE